MAWFFGKKRNEEEIEKEKKRLEEEKDKLKNISDDDLKRELESMTSGSLQSSLNRPQQAQIQAQKMKDAAQKAMREREIRREQERKEQELARMQKELEEQRRQGTEELEESKNEIIGYAREEINRINKETDEIAARNIDAASSISSRLSSMPMPGFERSRNIAIDKINEIYAAAQKDTPTAKKFEEMYGEIEGLSTWMDLGILPKSFSDEQKQRFKELTQEQKNDLLIPYYVEKIELGLNTQEDKEKYKGLLRDKGTKIPEQYTAGVELLQSFGLINVENKDCLSTSFDQYSTKSREDVKKQAEMKAMSDQPKSNAVQDSNTYTK